MDHKHNPYISEIHRLSILLSIPFSTPLPSLFFSFKRKITLHFGRTALVSNSLLQYDMKCQTGIYIQIIYVTTCFKACECML